MAAASSSFSSDAHEQNILGSVSGWVEARTHCPHLQVLNSDLRHLPALDTPCNRCDHPAENWTCLSCKEVLCSRFINGHMLEHYEQTGHCLAISYSDLSVWCFSCDAYLDALVIAQLHPAYETGHLLKFGVEPPRRSDLNGIELSSE